MIVNETLASVKDDVPLRYQYHDNANLREMVDAMMLYLYEHEQEDKFSENSTGAELKHVFRTLPVPVQTYLLSVYGNIKVIAKVTEEQKLENEKFRFKARIFSIGALVALATLSFVIIVVTMRGDSYEIYGHLGDHMRFIVELFNGLGGL